MNANEPANSHQDLLEEGAAPRPTYAPAAMALGVMMLLWGIVTMWVMSAAGAGVMAWSLWTWINEISEA